MSTPADITVTIADGLAVSYGTTTQPLGTQAAGTSNLIARADHVHAHGAQTDPTLHAIATGVANGFMSAADKAKIDSLTAGSAAVGSVAGAALNAATTAAAGSAVTAARSDHTHSVAAAVIGDVQPVGVAATGSAPRFALADHSHVHGAQTDPAAHAAVTGAANGFMLSVDKTKLDGIASGAIAASSTVPNAVGTAAIGVATTAARADHVHAHGTQAGGSLHAQVNSSVDGFMIAADKAKLDALPTNPATVGSVTPSPVGAAAVGVAATAARADHVHAHGTQAGGTLHAQVTGTADGFMIAADKAKLDNIAGSTTVTALAATGAVGALTTYAREDHAHAHGAQTDPTMHAAVSGSVNGFMLSADKTKLDGIATNATATPLASSAPASVTAGGPSVGVATTAAKADHVHSVATATAVGLDPTSASGAGTSASLARADHTHAIATAVSVLPVAATSTAGTANTFARGDHAHAHGVQSDPTMHTAVTGLANGFMAAADKTKLDALVAGIDIQQVNIVTDPGTSTSWARSDHVHSHGHLPADGQMHAKATNTNAGFAPALAGVSGYVLTDHGDGTATFLAPTGGGGGAPGANSVTTTTIVDSAVTSAKLAAGSVTTAILADANVTAAKIAAGAVGTSQLASGAVGATQIAAGAVGTTQIAAGAVGATQIAAGAVGATQIAAGAVTGTQIATGAVGATQLATGAVGTAQIAAGAVGAAQIATGGVGPGQLASGAVGTTQLAANAVTAAQIANATITSTQLAAASVATANVADGAITQAKLDAAVTLPLANNSVTTLKLVDANVTTAKLADGLITEAKFPSGFSLPVPTYTKAGLPSPDGKVRVAKLSDFNRGIWHSSGTAWTPEGGSVVFNPIDFGADPTGSADSSPAINLAIASMSAVTFDAVGYKISFSPGIYRLSSPIHVTRRLTMHGNGGGANNGTPAAYLKPDRGVTAIIVHFPGDGQIDGGTSDGGSGAGSVIENISIVGQIGYGAIPNWVAATVTAVGDMVVPTAYSQYYFKATSVTGDAKTAAVTEPTWPAVVYDAIGGSVSTTVVDNHVTWTAFHQTGILVHAPTHLNNISIFNMSGDGCQVTANTGLSPVTNANGASITQMYIENSKGNGFYVVGADANACIFQGINVKGYRGWGIWDSSFLGNSHVGHQIEAGGVALGAYYSDDANAYNTFTGCYSESGSGLNRIMHPATWLGGLVGDGFTTDSTGFIENAGILQGFSVLNSSGANYVRSSLGKADGSNGNPYAFGAQAESAPGVIVNGTQLNLSYRQSGYGAGFWGMDLLSNFDYSWAVATNQQTTYPNATLTVPQGLALGNPGESIGTLVRMYTGTVAPTTGTHVANELVFNKTPTAGKPFAWRCVASGTPGTWEALYSAVQAFPATLLPTGTTQTVDLSTGLNQNLSLASATGAVTLTISNPANGGRYTILVTQGAAARNIVWPANVKWPGGTAPTITATASKVDKIDLTYDGTNFFGTFAQNY